MESESTKKESPPSIKNYGSRSAIHTFLLAHDQQAEPSSITLPSLAVFKYITHSAKSTRPQFGFSWKIVGSLV